MFCAFSGGAFAPFLDLKTNCIFFVRCIVFLVQIAYNDSASRKGMISWLELQQTSASEQRVSHCKCFDHGFKKLNLFEISINQPNKETIAAMLEAERIAKDPSVKGYNDLDELFADLKK